MLTVLDSPSIRLAQEAERRRIARELHDSVVQSLITLVADLEYFQTRQLPTLDQSGQAVAGKVAAWQELARDSLTSMRQALGGLRQPGELDFGLEYAIQVALSELREAGYTVVFECDNWPIQLPLKYTSNIYYIVREALTNVGKHAHATSIKVCMFCFEDHLHVSISDDGVGLRKQSVVAHINGGFQQGLIGMRERTALLNGQLTIESVHGRSTCVDVDIPFLELPGKQNTDKRQNDDGLTEREMEMLLLIARGMLAKEIARTLDISEKTVRNHMSTIYRKLNIYDRSQLVIYAMRKGLIDIHDGL
jgi:signal transduction histidine kinase/DNA-binding CsgD family transcriptional regulator